MVENGTEEINVRKIVGKGQGEVLNAKTLSLAQVVFVTGRLNYTSLPCFYVLLWSSAAGHFSREGALA